jgi:(S)-citramalyl-CoA lyase
LLTERGHPTRLHVIIETNAGLEAAHDIARASDRIDALFFGGVDMAAELRCQNAWEPLLHARSRVVHAAAGAGLDVIDVPWLDLDDPDGMREAADTGARSGLCGQGRGASPPDRGHQRGLHPSTDAIARARRIITAFEEADTGLVVIDGKLIEKPVLREMHRITAIADRMGL